MPPLSWRVPTSGDPRLLRIALAQIGLASVVAALLLFVAMPRDWLAAALLGLIPLAVFMAFLRWQAYQRSLAGADNMRLDELGLHWFDAAGHENTFSRADVAGFHIGRHLDTLRPVPALTLHLAGGLESQPIELHPPATSDAVRQWLSQSWNIAEREQAPPQARGYDLSVAVYSECHDEFQEWHWEGTRDELIAFFALFAAVAKELPLPPPGVKPPAKIVMLSRRHPTRLRIAHAPAAHFQPNEIAAPASLLRKIAEQANRALLQSSSPIGDDKFNLSLRPKDVWTFHLHVRPA